jgi:hypothetical protein
MPADYSSTARSLALPVSPPRSPDFMEAPSRPSWPRSNSMAHSQTVGRGSQSYPQRIIQTAARFHRQGLRIFKNMTPLQKTIFVLLGLLSFILTTLFLIYNKSIFHWLEPKAEAWRNLPGGWAILWGLTFITAFPPLIGYSTCVTISGFVYGFPLG